MGRSPEIPCDHKAAARWRRGEWHHPPGARRRRHTGFVRRVAERDSPARRRCRGAAAAPAPASRQVSRRACARSRRDACPRARAPGHAPAPRRSRTRCARCRPPAPAGDNAARIPRRAPCRPEPESARPSSMREWRTQFAAAPDECHAVGFELRPGRRGPFDDGVMRRPDFGFVGCAAAPVGEQHALPRQELGAHEEFGEHRVSDVRRLRAQHQLDVGSHFDLACAREALLIDRRRTSASSSEDTCTSSVVTSRRRPDDFGAVLGEADLVTTSAARRRAEIRRTTPGRCRGRAAGSNCRCRRA